MIEPQSMHDGASAERDIDIGELKPHGPLLPSSNADGNAVAKRVVRRRNDRVIMNLPVEIITGGKKVRAVSQDLSPFGMFIRLSPPLDKGTVIQVVISPNGQRHVITGQVTHALNEVEARTLGRFPGIGVMFREPMRPSEHAFLEAINRLLERHAQSRPQADLRALFCRWGLPDALRMDRDAVFVGSCRLEWPGTLLLWLIGLGVQPIINRAYRPTDNAIVERNHQT